MTNGLEVGRRSDEDGEDEYRVDLREVAIGKRGQWRREESVTAPRPVRLEGLQGLRGTIFPDITTVTDTMILGG